MMTSQSPLPQFDGVLPLDKPAGPSSAQCLYALKKQGQRKIGHAGTLDPMASGVLIVLLGQATKLSGWLLRGGKKTYSGTFRLGIETDTWDITGRTVAEKPYPEISVAALAEAIDDWKNLTEQDAPAYSALKHNGQPLYKLARKGHDMPVKRRSIRVFNAELLAASLPHVSFRVTVSSGTYIRSLAHSLGMRLGCGAALSRLTREYSHPFSIDQCVSHPEISAGLSAAHVLPLQSALPDWPQIELGPAEAARIRNGNTIPAREAKAENAFLCVGGKPLALARISADGREWEVERGLWNQ